MSRSPTYAEICEVAERAISIFSNNGFNACLFGSTACALYGVARCPNVRDLSVVCYLYRTDRDDQDVDLIVLASEDTEYLKRLLTQEDGRFFLVPSRSRRARYKVLWYELPPARRGGARKCKIDILVPGGDLMIPHIPSQNVKRRDGLPVKPPLPLLLIKLQGWMDHRDSDRLDFQEKLLKRGDLNS